MTGDLVARHSDSWKHQELNPLQPQYPRNLHHWLYTVLPRLSPPLYIANLAYRQHFHQNGFPTMLIPPINRPPLPRIPPHHFSPQSNNFPPYIAKTKTFYAWVYQSQQLQTQTEYLILFSVVLHVI